MKSLSFLFYFTSTH